MTSDFRQFVTGTLIMELAATQFDQLILASNTQIDGGTLDVDLVDGFSPVLGDQFQIFSYGGLVGGPGFGVMDLPLIGPGLKWETSNLLITGIIEIVPALLGDFDFDGDVDGQDFLIWQQGGSHTPFSTSDLADWEANYGMVAPLSEVSAAVPEPSTMFLMLAATQILFLRVIRRGVRSQQLDDV